MATSDRTKIGKIEDLYNTLYDANKRAAMYLDLAEQQMLICKRIVDEIQTKES